VRSREENGNERRRKQGGVYWVISWGAGSQTERGGEAESGRERRVESGTKGKKDAEVGGRME